MRVRPASRPRPACRGPLRARAASRPGKLSRQPGDSQVMSIWWPVAPRPPRSSGLASSGGGRERGDYGVHGIALLSSAGPAGGCRLGPEA